MLQSKGNVSSRKKFSPSFNIFFKENIRPVGVHIRASDRIGLDHPEFMKDEKELQGYMSETIDALNKSKPEYVFVCSESKQCLDVFLRHLNKGIHVIEPIFDRHIPADYADLFALSLCSEIWMVSRFSTFSCVASLIGNIPLVTFIDDKEIRDKYLAQFKYQPSHGKRIVKERVLTRRTRLYQQIRKTLLFPPIKCLYRISSLVLIKVMSPLKSKQQN